MGTADVAASSGAATIHAADRDQADYFRRLLSERCAELQARIGANYRLWTSYQDVGELGEVRRVRRLIRTDETEQRTVQRLIDRLDERFFTTPSAATLVDRAPLVQTIVPDERPLAGMRRPWARVR